MMASSTSLASRRADMQRCIEAVIRPTLSSGSSTLRAVGEGGHTTTSMSLKDVVCPTEKTAWPR
jgi:hypothetical protein